MSGPTPLKYGSRDEKDSVFDACVAQESTGIVYEAVIGDDGCGGGGTFFLIKGFILTLFSVILPYTISILDHTPTKETNTELEYALSTVHLRARSVDRLEHCQ